MSEQFSSDSSEQESNQRAPESPGASLQAAREKAGLAPEAVADELNLTVDKVHALETDRYEKLASDVFALGYLRRYSKILGLDEHDIAERFRQWRAATHVEPAETPVRRKPGPPLYLVIGILVVLMAGLGAYFFVGSEDEPAASQRPSPTLPDEPISSEQAPGGQMPAEQATAEQFPATPMFRQNGNGADHAPSSVPEGYQRQAPPPPVTEPTSRSEPSAQQIEPSAPPSAAVPSPESSELADSEAEIATLDQLSFAFSDECWLEVRDASGQVLRAEVATAGQSLTLEGEAPFSIMLGNARAASVRYNGEPVTVNPQPGARTARITIGP